MKYIFSLLVLPLLFWSCEKEIDFDLESAAPKIVVEATIENGKAPFVVLTKSANYFGRIDPQVLAESFVHDALVSISDGQATHQLKEYQKRLAPGVVFFYYTTDSANLSGEIKGRLNTTYFLSIKVEETLYEAQTTIPNITKRIDSIWWKKAPRDTAGKAIVMIRATDPPGFGDYVRYFTKRNSEPFLPGINSVYDDLIIDGSTYDLEVDPGADRNLAYNEDARAFRKGDTVTLKLSNINKATYDFWRTMEYAYASVGNPFSTPVKVSSNISNGALGYFGGYAAQYRTIIIPR